MFRLLAPVIFISAYLYSCRQQFKQAKKQWTTNACVYDDWIRSKRYRIKNSNNFCQVPILLPYGRCKRIQSVRFLGPVWGRRPPYFLNEAYVRVYWHWPVGGQLAEFERLNATRSVTRVGMVPLSCSNLFHLFPKKTDGFSRRRICVEMMKGLRLTLPSDRNS